MTQKHHGPRYVLRDVQRTDLAGIKRVAALLNSQNLPDDEKALAELIDTSVRSFTGAIRNPFERQYIFVLEELRTARIVGTSMIIAQHGTRESPHIYLDIYEKEHYSAFLDKHLRHRVLQIGYNFEGPTEIGGLVVDPAFRHHDKPGKQLSFCRFLFMAIRPQRFRERVLAELMPPLTPEGKSRLWEAFGSKFTNLSYQDADRASRRNKEFIQQLFPQGEIYATLFSKSVQEVIGEVGPDTVGVRTMLEKIGFRYDEHIDPFDGGPHFSAPVREVGPIKLYARAKLSAEQLPAGEGEDRLVAIERPRRRQRFRAVWTLARFDEDAVLLPTPAVEALGAQTGDVVHTIPFY